MPRRDPPDYEAQRFEPPTQPWRRPIGVFSGDRAGSYDDGGFERDDDWERREGYSADLRAFHGEHRRDAAGGFGRHRAPNEREDYRGGHNAPDRRLWRDPREREYARHLRDIYEGPGEPAVRRGPKGYRRADTRIYEEVCEALEDSGLDASEINVRVEGGECTLEGTVRSRDDKRGAERIAERVRGVADVHNRLRVAPETQQ